MDKLDLPEEEVDALVTELAGLLGEVEKAPIKQIKRIIQYCGFDFVREVYDETVEIEARGGLMLSKQDRRRTMGGVFFYLTREKITEAQRFVIFPPFKNYQKSDTRPPIGVPILSWKERIALIELLKTVQGDVKSMRILLNGRPGNIEKRDDVVVTTMTQSAPISNLPRVVPRPPEQPTLYTIYISAVQWARIEESLANPADNLLVDGVCALDPETNSIAVFASNVYSELLNAKAKETAAAAKPPKPAKEPKPPKEAKPASDKAAPKAKAPAPVQPQTPAADVKKSRYADVQPTPTAVPAAPLNPNLPPDAARKLNELNASAALFRQKVNNLLGKPPGQQFGLEMTQKLLKNVEDEIAALLKKHNA
ncbi:MAG: hypothetical protein GC179_14920 [Anaerolineaceae bacterium]|nr:hypothetical protein [Anaerolineaceae bacterium]